MIVIEIEKLKSKKNKVLFDTGDILYLYDSEIKKIGITVDMEIDVEDYQSIVNEYVIARAKKKALAILERSINSEYQIRTKLVRADYSEDVISKVIQFLKYYNFIDDNLYAKIYIDSNKARKSKIELKVDLMRKGIDNEIINELIDMLEDDSEVNAIKKYIRKYQDASGNIPDNKKMKVLAALYRKGFKRDMINKVINMDDVY